MTEIGKEKQKAYLVPQSADLEEYMREFGGEQEV